MARDRPVQAEEPAELVRKAREAFLDNVRSRSNLISKSDWVAAACTGKDVLDLGCIGHTWRRCVDEGEAWLHSRIRACARSVVGFDVLEEDAGVLNGMGFDIRVGDAQDFDLGQNFDVIVAGDLIEHLENIGGFLEACSNHLRPGGVLLVATPNPFNFEQSLRCLFARGPAVNHQHVVWIDPSVMFELARRCSYRIESFAWLETGWHFPLRRLYWVFNWLAQWAMRLRPLGRRDFGVVLRPMPATSSDDNGNVVG